MAAPPGAALDGWSPVGAVEPRAAGEPMLWLQQGKARRPLEPAGLDHFADGVG